MHRKAAGHFSVPTPASNRGVALMIVLWLSVLLTIITGTFAYHTQLEGLMTRRAIDSLNAEQAMKAGVALAVRELKQSCMECRPWADGRPYRLTFENADLVIRIQDESGKISLNSATQTQLQTLFLSAGVEAEKASSLADAVLDYSDADSLVRLNGAERNDYVQAGLSYGPRNAPFESLEELLQVYGMSGPIYENVAKALTVYHNKSQPNLNLAPAEVLRALPDLTDKIANEVLQVRYQQFEESAPPITLPDGRQVSPARGNGPIFTIETEIELPNSERIELKTVIDLRSNTQDPIPYKLLKK